MHSHLNGDLQLLFRRLPGLDRGELFALAAGHEANADARRQAWMDVRAVTARIHAEVELDRLRSEIGSWAAHLDSITGQESGTGTVDLLLADARRAAAPAILDAAVALFLGSELPTAARDALLGPWESALGEAPQRRGL